MMTLYCLMYIITMIGLWRLEGVMLIHDGVTTDERILLLQCVHTVTMEWYSVHHLDHVSNIITQSNAISF